MKSGVLRFFGVTPIVAAPVVFVVVACVVVVLVDGDVTHLSVLGGEYRSQRWQRGEEWKRKRESSSLCHVRVRVVAGCCVW